MEIGPVRRRGSMRRTMAERPVGWRSKRTSQLSISAPRRGVITASRMLATGGTATSAASRRPSTGGWSVGDGADSGVLGGPLGRSSYAKDSALQKTISRTRMRVTRPVTVPGRGSEDATTSRKLQLRYCPTAPHATNGAVGNCKTFFSFIRPPFMKGTGLARRRTCRSWARSIISRLGTWST